jgi:hypothetical protein
MLGDIGERIFDTCELVQKARHNAVGIRNDSALRYEVPPQAWMTGLSISDWVTLVSARLGTPS